MAATRVSIPAAARQIIQDIKEISGGHTDEEVYAVLRECDMDPNEAAQRLLSRGTFHEVKRKRDKKKESRKELADPRLRPGVQGRDVKGGQGNYPSRELSNFNDLSGRKPLAGKESGVNQNMDKGNSIFVIRSMESKTSTSSSSLSGGLSNGPSQNGAPIEKKYPAAGHLLSSDSKRSPDQEDTENFTSVLDVSQSIKPRISAVDPIPCLSLEARSHDEMCSTNHDFENQQTAGVLEVTSRPSSSVRPSGNTPSSSCSSHSQQLNISQKDKLCNPKSTIKPTQAENVMFEDVPIRVGTVTLSVPVLNSARKEDLSQKVDKRLTEMQLSDKQHVIIPDHLQVAESEKYGLSFGSFGTSFEQTTPKGPEYEKSSTPSEDDSSEELHEVVCEPAMSCQGASSGTNMEADQGVQQLSVDDNSPHRVYGPSEIPEGAGSDLAKDSSAASHVPQDSAQTTKHGDQTQIPETLESQGINSNSFVAPSPGSSPLVPAASGAVSSSVVIPQPPVPLFHQPVGVHLPHYAPSFIPYNHYISPFYYPPHTLNHFISNAAVFPQPPSIGSMYPPVSASVAPPVKYSSNAYKTDDNTGSQTHVGIPGAYAVYGSSPSVYTDNPVVMNGASVETDDVIGSQFKETGQQSDGSTVWIPAPGQDVSLLQPTSFCGLPSQGQHLAFAPAQAGHGALRGMYHPAQTLGGPAFHPLQSSQTTAGAVETVGPPASGYQQPQHPQMNWGGY